MFLRVDGRDVYAYTGARPLVPAQHTVVFVHGAANDHGVWAWQSRYFAHHGFNALAVDLPGHGRSDGPALASVEAIAGWIPALLDAAGAPRAALVGHSLGALAALECAARHPARVERIALAGPAAPMTVADDLLDAARRDEHVAYELINGWSFSAARQLGGNAVPGVWMTGNAMRLMERTPAGVLAVDLTACHAYAHGVAAAAAVRCPSLVVTGARDIMAPSKNAQAVVAALSDVRVVSLPDSGHALMAEEPDAVLDALRSFL
ncbi:MAG TPA: alpha/beta hydrolase [Casimicrobiaceae bacterium]|nr:alpha/beta hydrolase [Casimicrobiaceae bacterium]